VLAVAIDDWLFDELAAFGAELEDLEPEPDEEETRPRTRRRKGSARFAVVRQ
jgi:hypothetical protein